MAAEKAHDKKNKELLRQANKSRRTSQAAVERSLNNARELNMLRTSLKNLKDQRQKAVKANVEYVNSFKGKKYNPLSAMQLSYNRKKQADEIRAIDKDIKDIERQISQVGEAQKEKYAKEKMDKYNKQKKKAKG